MQACLIYGHVFGSRSRGRCRAPLPRPGSSFGPALMAAGSDMCAKFQEFLSMLRAPKVPEKYEKIIIIINVAASSDNGPKPVAPQPRCL